MKTEVEGSMLYAGHSRHEMTKFIPENAQRILDVGCYTGKFGALLKSERVVEVWGVEATAEAAEEARVVLDHVIAEPFSAAIDLPDGHFDVAVFNDVLEHMVDPWDALRIAARKLRVGGCVVVSLPNLRHIENLLHVVWDGDFCYGPWGVRDKTHLRFFTRKSAIRMLEESGYSVEHVEGTNEEWWTSSIPRRVAFRVFSGYLEETKYRQFAFVAKPSRQ
jgi:2-polyprenyl-3-methyl-5-hydroxy-6-metoxy-1,4-benzoquinol methylase